MDGCPWLVNCGGGGGVRLRGQGKRGGEEGWVGRNKWEGMGRRSGREGSVMGVGGVCAMVMGRWWVERFIGLLNGVGEQGVEDGSGRCEVRGARCEVRGARCEVCGGDAEICCRGGLRDVGDCVGEHRLIQTMFPVPLARRF